MRKRLHLQQITAGEHPLGTADSHYLRDVLRLHPGASVVVFDGEGREAVAQVVTCTRRGVVLMIAPMAPVTEQTASSRHAVTLTVGVAQPKGQRADWLVEKLTELGVHRIVWLTCVRSVSQAEAHSQKSARWQRLIEAAAQQCGRSRLPTLEGPESVADLMARPTQHRLLASADGRSLGSWVQDVRAAAAISGDPGIAPMEIMVAVGPEGGFVAEEEALASAAGAVSISLGPHILRTETAALAAAAAVMSAF